MRVLLYIHAVCFIRDRLYVRDDIKILRPHADTRTAQQKAHVQHNKKHTYCTTTCVLCP